MLTIAQRLTLGTQHQQAGRRQEAEVLYRSILQEVPQHPYALQLLGVLAYQSGRSEEAVELMLRSIGPGVPAGFHSNLAAAYLALGRFEEAEASSREALRINPNLADAHNNLGVSLRRLGRLIEAEQCFRAALRIHPNHADAHCNLGVVLQRQEKLAEAVGHLQEAVRLAPGNAQAQNDLGGVLLACNLPEKAIPYLREAIRLRPGFAEAHNNLGVALRDMSLFDVADEQFHEALRLNPGCAGAHNNLGFLLESQGKIAEALAEFHECLRLEPNNSQALYRLTVLAASGHYQLSDDERQRLKAIEKRNDLPAEDLSRMHFAIARADETAGAYNAAFEHYRLGNDLRKALVANRGAVYNPAAQTRTVDRLIAAYSPAWFERVRPFGTDSDLPIFIVGMMRSGTTLAEQILASHPRVHGAGELPEFGQLVHSLPKRLGGMEEYPECVTRLDEATARAVAAEYLARLRQADSEAARVVDKLPFNYLNLGLIAALFPKAHIIHCRRDPIDTCVSCYVQSFGQPHPFTLDLAHLGHYYREYNRLMAHWTRVLPVPIFELQYEELTAEQEAVSRRMVEFCGLEWDERCLRFNETERVVRTASSLQVRQPMYRSSVGRWKRYEKHLKPLLDALGQG
jgi:tetratricopeptide (TPR) repeat protein